MIQGTAASLRAGFLFVPLLLASGPIAGVVASRPVALSNALFFPPRLREGRLRAPVHPIHVRAMLEMQGDDVSRERLVEICNALRDRWGSVERIYETTASNLHRKAAGEAGQDGGIDMDAFMSAVEAAEVRCSHKEMVEVFKAVDLDDSGTLEMEELRLALRESGAILRTYQQSLSTMFAAIGAAMAFALAMAATRGTSDAVDFATAYVIEDSLSVDNLFVFVLLFEYFRVPLWLQQRCLTIGIAGAVVLRGVFIASGLFLIEKFHALVVLFGGFLVYSSYSILSGGEEDEDEDVGSNAIVKWAVGSLNATSDFDGARLFTRRGMSDEDVVALGPLGFLGRPTPLLLVLVCVELSDILFAVDSIPAVFGVTSDPFVAFTSNIFAIIGLRSLYSVLANAVQDLAYLEQAVAIVLGFVGVKLLAEGAGAHVDTAVSLAVVGSVLFTGIGLSLAEQADRLDAEAQEATQGKDDLILPQAPVPVVVRVSKQAKLALMALWGSLLNILGVADGESSTEEVDAVADNGPTKP